MLNVSIPEVCCLGPSWTIEESFKLRHQPRSWLCRHTYVLEGVVSVTLAQEEAQARQLTAEVS